MRRSWFPGTTASSFISIHAPLAGCDECDSQQRYERLQISIHAPLAGCDSLMPLQRPFYSHFNPRTPCGVRPLLRGNCIPSCDFNPRTPCGVRPALPSIGGPPCRNFNPRTPCGVRLVCGFICHNIVKFQSTHPLRGATFCICRAFARSTFQSTHPLRGATGEIFNTLSDKQFQSTHPLRGAT